MSGSVQIAAITDQNYREYEVKAESSKNSELQYQLGQYYLKSANYYYGRREEAAKWLRRAAEQMHNQAISILTELVLKNDSHGEILETVKLYKKLATQEGGAVAKEALKVKGSLYQALVSLGDRSHSSEVRGGALYLLAHLHKDSAFGAVDANEVVRYYEKAKAYGHTDAANELADIYYHGNLVPKDFKKAFVIFDETCRGYSLRPNGYSYFSFAWLYHRGEGVEKNLDKAIENYEKALREGYAAHYQLGLSYRERYQATQGKNNQSSWQIQNDKDKAIELFKQVPEQHKQWKEAQNYLGFLYAEQKSDIFKAAEAWQKARLPESLYQMGLRCVEGSFGPQHMDKAKGFYEEAAEQGSVPAYYELACGYELGRWGLPKDLVKAFEWLQKAQKAKNEDAARKMATQPFAHLDALFCGLAGYYDNEAENLKALKKHFELEEVLGYRFAQPKYLLLALNRIINEITKEAFYQRYELIGDSCLNLVINRYLVAQPEKWVLGQLDAVKQKMVANNTVMPQISKKLKLSELLVLDKSEKAGEITEKMSVDAVEALIGAVLQDSNFEQAEKIVLAFWRPHLEAALHSQPKAVIILLEEKKYITPFAPATAMQDPLSRRLSKGSEEFFTNLPIWGLKELQASLKEKPARAKALNSGKVGMNGLIILIKQLILLRRKGKIEENFLKIECLLESGAELSQTSRKGVTAQELLSEVSDFSVKTRVLQVAARVKARQSNLAI